MQKLDKGGILAIDTFDLGINYTHILEREVALALNANNIKFTNKFILLILIKFSCKEIKTHGASLCCHEP
jgi:hypothetical protein